MRRSRGARSGKEREKRWGDEGEKNGKFSRARSVVDDEVRKSEKKTEKKMFPFLSSTFIVTALSLFYTLSPSPRSGPSNRIIS